MAVEEEIGTVFRPLLFRLKADKRTVPNSFVDENVSTKVVKIIQSYVGIVNKMVWRKDQ